MHYRFRDDTDFNTGFNTNYNSEDDTDFISDDGTDFISDNDTDNDTDDDTDFNSDDDPDDDPDDDTDNDTGTAITTIRQVHSPLSMERVLTNRVEMKPIRVELQYHDTTEVKTPATLGNLQQLNRRRRFDHLRAQRLLYPSGLDKSTTTQQTKTIWPP